MPVDAAMLLGWRDGVTADSFGLQPRESPLDQGVFC